MKDKIIRYILIFLICALAVGICVECQSKKENKETSGIVIEDNRGPELKKITERALIKGE